MFYFYFVFVSSSVQIVKEKRLLYTLQSKVEVELEKFLLRRRIESIFFESNSSTMSADIIFGTSLVRTYLNSNTPIKTCIIFTCS